MSLLALPTELYFAIAEKLNAQDRLNMRLTHPQFAHSIKANTVASESLQQRAEMAASLWHVRFFNDDGSAFGTGVRDAFTDRVFDIPTRVPGILHSRLNPNEQRQIIVAPIPATRQLILAFDRLPEVAKALSDEHVVSAAMHFELDYLAARRLRSQAELGHIAGFLCDRRDVSAYTQEINALRQWTSKILDTRDMPLMRALQMPIPLERASHCTSPSTQIDPALRSPVESLSWLEELTGPQAQALSWAQFYLTTLARKNDDKSAFIPYTGDAHSEAQQAGLVFGLVVRVGLHEIERKSSPETMLMVAGRLSAALDIMVVDEAMGNVNNLFMGPSFKRVRALCAGEQFRAAAANRARDRLGVEPAYVAQPVGMLREAFAAVFNKAIEMPASARRPVASNEEIVGSESSSEA